MSHGQKIIRGLQEAVDGEFQWVRKCHVKQAVAAERAEILAMIEGFADEQPVGRRAADYIVAAIKAREENDRHRR
jgi:hypothetical protein